MKLTDTRISQIMGMDEHDLLVEHPSMIMKHDMFIAAAHTAGVWSIKWDDLGPNPTFHRTLAQIPEAQKLAFWRAYTIQHEMAEEHAALTTA